MSIWRLFQCKLLWDSRQNYSCHSARAFQVETFRKTFVKPVNAADTLYSYIYPIIIDLEKLCFISKRFSGNNVPLPPSLCLAGLPSPSLTSCSWSSWTQWSACSVSCGDGGRQGRRRRRRRSVHGRTGLSGGQFFSLNRAPENMQNHGPNSVCKFAIFGEIGPCFKCAPLKNGSMAELTAIFPKKCKITL